MSNRSVIEHALTVYFDESTAPGDMARTLVDRLLAEHAHELAKKIRRELNAPHGQDTAANAADLIDPKKEGQ